jgi:hypothetical protein
MSSRDVSHLRSNTVQKSYAYMRPTCGMHQSMRYAPIQAVCTNHIQIDESAAMPCAMQGSTFGPLTVSWRPSYSSSGISEWDSYAEVVRRWPASSLNDGVSKVRPSFQRKGPLIQSVYPIIPKASVIPSV